jgi:2-polyprenyl-6-methoxyphenol hydroxylase-like FAD-dependent oxidoreductase
MKINVLVTGAGPVGLAMAVELARYGMSLRIVDKAAERTDKSKALVLWARTLELLDSAGCSRPLIDAGCKVSAVNLVEGSKQIGHLTLDGVASPHPYALMLPQSETERLLDEHLNTLGVKVERSVELTQFAAAADKVVCTLRHADGHEEQLEATWLIGCDGAHSTVRHLLGMEFVGDTMASNWILADVHLSGVPWKGEIDIVWHADGVLAIFPIVQGRYRIIADVGNAAAGAEQSDPTLSEVQAILDQRGPGGIVASDPVWMAGFRINERKVADYRSGQVFLAGDAAHIHSPAGGQGMNTGIQDACNLAWKLALVHRGSCAAEPVLGSYSLERSEVGKQVLAETGRATAIGLIRGDIKQAIRNHIASLIFGLSPIRKAMAEVVTELSIGYPHSPLNGGSSRGGPAPGERAPIRAEETPVGAGTTPRFALFADAGDAASQLIARYAGILEANIRKPFHEGGLWLVRPDGYTAFATGHDGWDQAAAYLDRLGCSSPTEKASAVGAGVI